MDNKEKQKLRLRRFAMAVMTYLMAIMALFIITQLDMGTLDRASWGIIIGLCIAGNILFLTLFITGINCRFSDPSLTALQIMFSSVWGMVPLWHLPDARPLLLMFFLPAFGFGMLKLNLRQYLFLVFWDIALFGSMLLTEYMINRPGFRPEQQLFIFVLFAILLTWLAVFGGFVSRMRRNLKHRNHVIQKMHEELKKEVDIRCLAEKEKDRLIEDLQKALGDVKTLSGLLPICANCKKIRDDKGYWNQIEEYIMDHSYADFSHGICPECTKALYPEFDL